MNDSISLTSYPAAAAFLERVQAELETHEARNGLMLGIAMACAKNPQAFGKKEPYFATVQDQNDELVCAAIMTPPHGPVLYLPSDGLNDSERAAIVAIARDLTAKKRRIPAVQSTSAGAVVFADWWSERHGLLYELDAALRAFECRDVTLPSTMSAGVMRVATEADVELVTAWIHAFHEEALDKPADDARLQERIPERIKHGHYFLWDDNGPVSLAGIGRPTERSLAIGPVYTPPEHRGRGYAGCTVALVSQKILDEGKAFCTLFTNLENPTSNKIYQRIGYRAVGDFKMFRFRSNPDCGTITS